MATNFSIDKLTGSENYPIWYAAIYDHFKAKKLTKYVTSNYLATLKISESSTANERKFYDDCIAEDAQVCSDITANVVDRIKFFIKDSPNAYAKMQKLKTLYYIDNSALCGIHSINYISNVRNYDKQTKFCLICGNQGHFAKDCYFNPCGTNKNNSRVKIINNKNNNYNKGSCNNNNNKRRNKNNNRKRRNNNTINNIECLDEREFTPCYEEINIMHGKFIDSIEYNNIMILNIMNKQIT
ncbi:hypothetical protein U3516DRAFT_571171 [Neocallimastix sp. 'constans']